MSVLLKAGLGLLALLALLFYVPGGWMLVLVLLAVALVMGSFLGYVWLQEAGPAERRAPSAQDILRERLRRRLGFS
jgi:hypothetical protein